MPSGNQLQGHEKGDGIACCAGRTAGSPSQRSQQSQSRGRCCGQQQARSHHEWCLGKETRQLTRVKRATDGTRTRGGREGVGGTKHGAASLDRVETLPDHGDDGAGGHVLDEAGEEGLALEVSVVCKKSALSDAARGRWACQRD